MKKLCVVYKNEPLKRLGSLKFFGLEVPEIIDGNEWCTNPLEVRKRAYYTIEDTFNGGEIKSWASKKYPFDSCPHQFSPIRLK